MTSYSASIYNSVISIGIGESLFIFKKINDPERVKPSLEYKQTSIINHWKGLVDIIEGEALPRTNKSRELVKKEN